MKLCECGEPAYFDSYVNRTSECARCYEPICRDCAWCGESATGDEVHRSCLAGATEHALFAEAVERQAQYVAEAIARRERVRLRWNAEHAEIQRKAQEHVAAMYGLAVGEQLTTWVEEQERRERERRIMDAEHRRIEEEEVVKDIRNRRKATEATP